MRKTIPCNISFDPAATEYRVETFRLKTLGLAIATVAVAVMTLGVASLHADDVALPPDPSRMPSDDILSRFEAGRFEDPNMPLDYRLMRPRSPKAGTRYPLIVWLSGYGPEELKLPNLGQLRHTDLAINSLDVETDFYMLVPQVPNSVGAWRIPRATSVDDEPITTVRKIIDALLAEEPIDPDRVGLLGISAGATSSWELLMRYPDTFAGAVLFAATAEDFTRVDRLCGTPIWALKYDHDSGVEEERTMVSAINDEGGNACLTEFPGPYHDVYEPAFKSDKYDVMEWLLSQDRGAWLARPQEYVKWRWWQVALQIGLPAVLILTVFCEVRRRAVRGRVRTRH